MIIPLAILLNIITIRFKRPSGVWFFYGRRNHRRFSWNNIMELTDRNVINVLSELAPYIEADGGYLEFVEIDYMNEGAFVKEDLVVLVLHVL